MTDLVNSGLVVLNNRTEDSANGDDRESTIIVTGVARGGTSMLAQILDRLGLFLGDLHDPVVNEDMEILDALQNFDIGRLEHIIADRNRRCTKWGFKLPHLYNFLPANDAARFRHPRYIVVFRDPLAVARRMELSTNHDIADSISQASMECMKLTSYVLALTAPVLLISYEKALRNKEHVVEAMIAFCGLTPSMQQRDAALKTIKPDDATYIWATQTTYLGALDNISGNTLRGWCCYRDSANIVEIELFADGQSLGHYPSRDFRDDLQSAGIHLGFHAFNIDLSPFDIHLSTLISVSPAKSLLTLPNSGASVDELRTR